MLEAASGLLSTDANPRDGLIEQLRSENTHLRAEAARSHAENTQLRQTLPRLQELERTLVGQALKQADNNQTRAAKLLHLSRDQLRYRMERYGLGN